MGPRTDAQQQAAPAAPASASLSAQEEGAAAQDEADRLKATKALIDERMAAVNDPGCSKWSGVPLAVHLSFARTGAASGFEVVHSNNDPDYDTCKVGVMRWATSQLLYINGVPFEGDVIYTVINHGVTVLEAARAPALAQASALLLQLLRRHPLRIPGCRPMWRRSSPRTSNPPPAKAAPHAPTRRYCGVVHTLQRCFGIFEPLSGARTGYTQEKYDQCVSTRADKTPRNGKHDAYSVV